VAGQHEGDGARGTRSSYRYVDTGNRRAVLVHDATGDRDAGVELDEDLASLPLGQRLELLRPARSEGMIDVEDERDAGGHTDELEAPVPAGGCGGDRHSPRRPRAFDVEKLLGIAVTRQLRANALPRLR